MTIAQAENFYEKDSKDYEIEKNKDFLKWLKNTIDDGYHCFIDTEELQELIDNIVNWYEIKYPERELEYFEGIKHTDFKDIRKISDAMNIRQLLFRLPHDQLNLLECGYRAKGWGQSPVIKDGKEVDWNVQIFMEIDKKNDGKSNSLWEKTPYFLLCADHMTGEVSKNYWLGKNLDSKENLSLDELLAIFNEKYADELDFTELKECVYDHDCDMELRHRILQLAALKLLYSKNTIPERGYERAKRFINEFNKNLGLTLSTKEIDKAINEDYTNGEKQEQGLKTHANKDSGEYYYWTIENAPKKEKQLEGPKKIKQMVKEIFNKNNQ